MQKRIIGLAYICLGAIGLTAALPLALLCLVGFPGIVLFAEAYVTGNYPDLPFYLARPFKGVIIGLPAILALGTLAGLVFGSYQAIKRGMRLKAPTGEEALAKDQRPPIVYLRSFKTDHALEREEEAIARIFSAAGPFIAIGKPGEQLPPLGASRFYVPDDKWQDFVLSHLEKARLAIIVTGGTPGVGWEVDRCWRLLGHEKLLIVIMRDRQGYELFRQRAYQTSELQLPEFPRSELEQEYSGNIVGFLRFDHHGYADFIQPIAPSDVVNAVLNDKVAPGTEGEIIEKTIRNSLSQTLSELGIELDAYRPKLRAVIPKFLYKVFSLAILRPYLFWPSIAFVVLVTILLLELLPRL